MVVLFIVVNEYKLWAQYTGGSHIGTRPTGCHGNPLTPKAISPFACKRKMLQHELSTTATIMQSSYKKSLHKVIVPALTFDLGCRSPFKSKHAPRVLDKNVNTSFLNQLKMEFLRELLSGSLIFYTITWKLRWILRNIWRGVVGSVKNIIPPIFLLLYLPNYAGFAYQSQKNKEYLPWLN